MTAIRLDGKATAAAVKSELGARVAALVAAETARGLPDRCAMVWTHIVCPAA